jgi:hypothetical protein
MSKIEETKVKCEECGGDAKIVKRYSDNERLGIVETYWECENCGRDYDYLM